VNPEGEGGVGAQVGLTRIIELVKALTSWSRFI